MSDINHKFSLCFSYFPERLKACVTWNKKKKTSNKKTHDQNTNSQASLYKEFNCPHQWWKFLIILLTWNQLIGNSFPLWNSLMAEPGVHWEAHQCCWDCRLMWALRITCASQLCTFSKHRLARMRLHWMKGTNKIAPKL